MEILEKQILTKFLFLDLVKLRVVSKSWRSEVIPRAAQIGQAPTRVVLLYLHLTPKKGDLWWSRIDNAESNQIDRKLPPYIVPKHFPDYDYGGALMIASEEGLLFHAITVYMHDLDIFHCPFLAIAVLNPLTGKSRKLRLPKPLLYIGAFVKVLGVILAGVVVDGVTGNYKLVIAGYDLQDKFKSYLYDSSVDEWTDGRPFILPVLPRGHAPGPDMSELKFSSTQGVYVNDNFYWSCTWAPRFPRRAGECVFVFKFDVQKMTWSLVQVDFELGYPCLTKWGSLQIAACKDEVLTWHAHELLDNHLKFTTGDEEGDHNEGEDHQDRRCKIGLRMSDLDWDPNLKLMPQDMIHAMDEFLKMPEDKELNDMARMYTWGRRPSLDYSTFSQGDFFYHIIHVFNNGKDPYLRILVHNTEENSYTELPTVKVSMICEDKRDFRLRDTWKFSASLISKP